MNSNKGRGMRQGVGFVCGWGVLALLTAAGCGAVANLGTNPQTTGDGGNGGDGDEPVTAGTNAAVATQATAGLEEATKLISAIRAGQGTSGKLLTDDSLYSEINRFILAAEDVTTKINSGEGTAGKLIADPAVYESVNDILIGINESRLLRWMVRNRQQTGIEKRYEAEKQAEPVTPPPPPAQPVATATAPE